MLPAAFHFLIFFFYSKAVARRCSVKKGFLEILQNSQENACARVFLFLPQVCNFIKKRLWYGCFPVSFAKFLRTPFLQNTCGGCFCGLRSH